MPTAPGPVHPRPLTGALVPVVVEQTSRGERNFDIFAARERIVFVTSRSKMAWHR